LVNTKETLKKLLIILLTTVYSISSLGVTLHFFYCCHKLSNVSISAVEPVDNCKTIAKGCCTNETLSIKLSSDQNKTSIQQLIATTYAIIPEKTYQYIVNSFVEQITITKHPLVYPPPNQPSRQTLYCIFRI